MLFSNCILGRYASPVQVLALASIVVIVIGKLDLVASFQRAVEANVSQLTSLG